jgi:hypothetical protein
MAAPSLCGHVDRAVEIRLVHASDRSRRRPDGDADGAPGAVELTVEVIDRLEKIDQGGLRVTLGAASLAESAVDVADRPRGRDEGRHPAHSREMSNPPPTVTAPLPRGGNGRRKVQVSAVEGDSEAVQLLTRQANVISDGVSRINARFQGPMPLIGKIVYLIGAAEVRFVAADIREDAGQVVGTMYVWTDDVVIHGEARIEDGRRVTAAAVHARRDLERIELVGENEDDWPRPYEYGWPPFGQLRLTYGNELGTFTIPGEVNRLGDPLRESLARFLPSLLRDVNL